MKNTFFSMVFMTGLLAMPSCLLADETVSTATPAPVAVSTVPASVVHAIHLTASAAGSAKYRKNHLDKMLSDTIINAVVVDIKEEDGHVYVPGVKMAERAGAYVREIPD